jgi:hypothetical protein
MFIVRVIVRVKVRIKKFLFVVLSFLLLRHL